MTKLKGHDVGLGNPFPPRFRDSNGQRRRPDLIANAVEPSVYLKLQRRIGGGLGRLKRDSPLFAGDRAWYEVSSLSSINSTQKSW